MLWPLRVYLSRRLPILRLQKFKTFHRVNRYFLASHQIPGTLLDGWVGDYTREESKVTLPAHPASIPEGHQTSAKIYTQVDHGLNIEQCGKSKEAPEIVLLPRVFSKSLKTGESLGKTRAGTFWAGHRP